METSPPTPKRNATLVKCCFIPQRFMVAIMGAFGCLTAYTTRVSLNIAITQMVHRWNKTVSNSSQCPMDDEYHESQVKKEEPYDWDERMQGIILGAFFWGYIVGHIPSGILAVRCGARHIFGGGVSISVIIALLTPITVIYSDGLTALLAKWSPARERSITATIVYGSGLFGTVVSNLSNGHLMAYTQSWSSVFYFWGGLGFLWVIFWYILVFSTPQSCPYISDKELEYLNAEIGDGTAPKMKVPWKAIFSSSAVWAIILSQIGYDYGFYTMLTDLPKYLNDMLRFDIKSNGMWNSIPYIFMWVSSIIAGLICSVLINKKVWSVTVARKFFSLSSLFVPACLLIGASYAGCDKDLAAWLFTFALTFMGHYYCGIKVNALDLSPNFSGIIMSISNGCGALTGVLAPLVIGFLTTNHSMDEWRIVFWINFAIMVTAGVIYGIWASAKLQWWNDAASKPEEPT